jgi:hypothetical protein
LPARCPYPLHIQGAYAGKEFHAIVGRFVKPLVKDDFVIPVPRLRELGDARDGTRSAGILVAISINVKL